MMRRIREFFMNRYGTDQLNRALMVVYALFFFVYLITKNNVFLFIALAVALYQVFRTLSRNFTQRAKENQFFLKYWNPVKRKYSSIKKKRHFLHIRKNRPFFR